MQQFEMQQKLMNAVNLQGLYNKVQDLSFDVKQGKVTACLVAKNVQLDQQIGSEYKLLKQLLV